MRAVPLSSPGADIPFIAELFARHGLGPVYSVRALAGGQINQVLEVNGAYVVRVRPPEKDGGAFVTEQRLFPRLRGRVPVPEVVAVEGPYAIARKLPGDNLVRVWITASERRRGWLVTQLGELLRALHEESLPACGRFQSGELVGAASWDAYLQLRFERRLAKTRAMPNADPALLDAIEAYWRRNRGALYERPPCLVHRDVHFGNVLVSDNGISGLLDFEAALAAPCDYELDQLLRFLRYPALFVEEDLEAHVSPALFGGVWRGLADVYPEPFRVPHLRQRLSIYSLEYDLAALRNCYAGRWSANALRHVVDHRIRGALEERLLPSA